MAYATHADLIRRFPKRDLEQMTDEEGQVMDTDSMDLALEDASCEIDCYLEGRFKLPLVPANTPAVVKRMCCDIGFYRLLTMRPVHDGEDARKRYEDALDMLTKVSKGQLTLGLSPLPDKLEPPSATPLVVLAPSSNVGSTYVSHRDNGWSPLFTRRSLRSY